MNSLSRIILTCATLFLLAISPMEELNGELDQIEQADKSGTLSRDIEMTRGFIQKAQAAEGRAKKRYEKRAELAMDLVRALVVQAQISDAADAQEIAAYSGPETLKKLKEKVEALSKRRDELKKTIQKLER